MCARARVYWHRLCTRRQIYARKSKKYSMDGNAQAEPCTRKLAWFRSATCMVGLHNLHGSARRSAWFSFRRCMVGLKKPASGIKNHARYPSLLASSRRLSAHALNHPILVFSLIFRHHGREGPSPQFPSYFSQPPRQEVFPSPLKLLRTSRLLIPRQVQHPRPQLWFIIWLLG